MKKLIFIYTIMFFLYSGVIMGQTIKNESPILPVPKEWQWQKGIFQIDPQITIYTTDLSNSAGLHLQNDLEEMSGFKLKLEIITNSDFSKRGIYLLQFDLNEQTKKYLQDNNTSFTSEMLEEGYILSAEPDKILILSKSQRGFFYGVQSLKFLMKQQKVKTKIPAVFIRDWPDLKMRGITDDISRGQVSTMENFKKIIRFLAEYKMNVYMPYLEDFFQFKSYPSIGKNRGALSAEECIELQDYAAQYHIEVIPIFQTLGHYENILIQPEYMHLADFPGAASLNTTSEETYRFLEKVLDEIIPVFRSPYFHIGADESWDVGKGASRDAASRYGVATVHARHYNRVFEIVKKHNKKIMMYGDIVLDHPTILNEIPNDIIMFDWHYFPRDFYESAETFKNAGQPFIVSAGVHNWRNIFPNITDALANIRQITIDGWKNGAIGSITSNWGDYGAFNLRELNYYAHAYAAACAWNVEQNDLFVFEKNFFKNFYDSESVLLPFVYHLLNKTRQHVNFLHFFGHPFYPQSEKNIELIRQSEELALYSTQITNALSLLKNENIRNEDHIDYLEICASLYNWYGRLSQLQLKLVQIIKYESEQEQRIQYAAPLSSDLKSLADELATLAKTYKQLWIRNNREANLYRIQDLFNRMQKYLLIKAEEIENGNFAFNGKLTSPFISHPNTENENARVSHIFLRKEFDLEGKPEKAVIQAIANSHAKVWINGKKVGDVVARKSLSAWVESQRVKSWNVESLLKKGKNVIAVEVNDYIPEAKASANIWLQYKLNDKWSAPVASNAYWMVSDLYERDWNSPDFDDEHWKTSLVVPNKWHISRPYFEHDLPSRIEFYW